MVSRSRNERRVDRRAAPLRALSVLALTAVALGGTVDCMQERAPITRVQENHLRKQWLVGANYTDATDDPEFYMENFVVDAPADQSLMPVGTYDDVDRIHWEIQENLLIARKSYEYISGADGRGDQTQARTDSRGRRVTRVQNGLIVAAYRITSQFDIRNSYNPSTGEPINVIEENQSDRRWYERDFIRVDWSRNLVDNPDWAWMFYGTLFGDLSFQPVAYSETNPASPDANNLCEIEPGMIRTEDGRCVKTNDTARYPGGYFDITSKWLVNPEMSHFFGEPLPTCLIANFFSNSPVYSCNPQETTVRTAFRRVVDRDFEPLELTVQPYDLVGGPRADRNGYDPGYGLQDANMHRYAMIHNLWMQSHLSPAVQCTANTDANSDGTADQCQTAAAGAHPGSQCDTVMGRCTLPYRERAVRPVVYYVNPQMPPEMQNHVVVTSGSQRSYRLPRAGDAANTVVRGPSEDIINSWNAALTAAVAKAREVECRRTGGERAQCHMRYFESDTNETARLAPQEDGAWLAARPRAVRDGNRPVVVLCHNPVAEGDPQPECREVGYSARVGDLRYHHITYWPGNTRAPFGGIAHWGYDPLTGEIVCNGGFNMGRSVDAAAAQQRDYILMALGDLSVDQYVAGEASERFSRILRNPAAEVRPRLSDDEIDARTHAQNRVTAAAALGMNLRQARDAAEAVERHDRLFTMSSTPTNPATTSTALRYRQTAAALRNTTIESDMVDSEWLANLGYDPSSQRTEALLDATSPLRRMDPELAEAAWTSLMQRAESRGFCFQDAGAPPVVGSMDIQGVARWYRRQYGTLSADERSARIYQDLRQEAYKGIALHEIGHSIGLYHLPVSSYDSMNYNPQYWQLRTKNGTATRACVTQCTANSCPNARNADRNNDNCMGPRYQDDYSDEELGLADSDNPHAGINYFGNTSVMEYQWERFDETVGIGSYDHYATGLLYGRVVETMESDTTRGGMTVEQQNNYSARLRTQLTELDQINWTDPFINSSGILPIHYTELARRLNAFDPTRCRDATAAEKARYKWRLVDGKICSFGPRDYASLTDMETGPIPGSTSDRVAPFWHTRVGTRSGENVVRWAYKVAWDIGTGYPHINYFDQGADIYETTQSMVFKYHTTYPSMYFRRGNREFTGFNIPAYYARRLFRLLRGYHWSVARDVSYYSTAFSAATYENLTRDYNWMQPYLVAGTDIFDFFARVLLMPEPGDFGRVNETLPDRRGFFDDVASNDNTMDAMFRVPLIEGRYIGQEYDNSRGGSWNYHAYLIHAGSYPEKPIAAIMLTDTRPTFSSITRSLYLDGREFQVNFGTDMPDALNRLLGGVLAEDWDSVAPHCVPENDPSSNLPLCRVGVLPLWRQPSRTDPTGVPRRPASAPLLFPNIGYRQQLPTYVYAMLFSSLNSDLSTIHRMRIWVEGGPEQVDVPEVDRVRFRNPETGITYVGRRYGPDNIDGEQVDRGIASRMIARANELLADTYQVELDARLRPVRNADGSLRVIINETTRQPVPAHPDDASVQAAAVTRFHNYVGLIDAARYASRLLGYGTLR